MIARIWRWLSGSAEIDRLRARTELLEYQRRTLMARIGEPQKSADESAQLQPREMIEGDLWSSDWLEGERSRAHDRARLEILAKQQPSLLELGKQLGIYPQRTFLDERGMRVIPNADDEVEARRKLRDALRARRRTS